MYVSNGEKGRRVVLGVEEEIKLSNKGPRIAHSTILIMPLHILGSNGFGASESVSASSQLRPERTDQI